MPCYSQDLLCLLLPAPVSGSGLRTRGGRVRAVELFLALRVRSKIRDVAERHSAIAGDSPGRALSEIQPRVWFSRGIFIAEMVSVRAWRRLILKERSLLLG